MLYLLTDLLLKNYFNLNTFLVILNINRKSYFEVIILGLILDFIILNTFYITLLFILLKYTLSNFKLNLFLKDTISLIIFILSSFSFQNSPYIIILNTLIYFIWYTLSSKNISFNEMMKNGKFRRYSK